MKNMLLYKQLMLTVITALTFSTDVFSQTIVHVDSEKTGIYEGPDVESEPFMIAQEGDLFELETSGKYWIGIKLFSGETRFLKRDDVSIQDDLYEGQSSLSERLQLCDDVQKIERDAASEAQSQYPNNEGLADSYEQMIIDERILSLFRRHSVAAIHRSIFLDCINDSIVPISGS